MLEGATGVYNGFRRLQVVTGGFRRLQGITRDDRGVSFRWGNKGFQLVRRGYRRIIGGYKGLQGVTRGYRGLQWV